MLHRGRWHTRGGHVASIIFENRVDLIWLGLMLNVVIPWLLELVPGVGGRVRVGRLEMISISVRMMVLIVVELGSVEGLLYLRPGSKTRGILQVGLVGAFSKLPIIGYKHVLATRNPSKKVVA